MIVRGVGVGVEGVVPLGLELRGMGGVLLGAGFDLGFCLGERRGGLRFYDIMDDYDYAFFFGMTVDSFRGKSCGILND